MTRDNPLYATESAENDPALLSDTSHPENASGGDADQPRQALPDDTLQALRQEYERRRS